MENQNFAPYSSNLTKNPVMIKAIVSRSFITRSLIIGGIVIGSMASCTAPAHCDAYPRSSRAQKTKKHHNRISQVVRTAPVFPS
jgi:hypothetical protein